MNVFMARSGRGFSLSPRGTSGERVGARRILESAFPAELERGHLGRPAGETPALRFRGEVDVREVFQTAPPLPSPLLHLMEERERIQQPSVS